MATEDKQRILDWCGADSDVRYVQEGADPGADFSLVLESTGTELTATLPSGSDRIVLRNVVDLAQAAQPAGSGDLAADLTDLEERRPGPVTVVLEPTGEAVAVSTWVVSDGLTKHSFLTAVSDVIRTRGAVLRLAGLPADLPAAEAAGTVAAPEEHEVPEVALSGASTEAVPEMAAVSEQAATSEPSPWAWTPSAPTPVYSAAEERSRRRPTASPEDAAAGTCGRGAGGGAGLRGRAHHRDAGRGAGRRGAQRPGAGVGLQRLGSGDIRGRGAGARARRHHRARRGAAPSGLVGRAPGQPPPRASRRHLQLVGPPDTPAAEVAETPAAGVEEQVPAYSPWGSPALTPEQPAARPSRCPRPPCPVSSRSRRRPARGRHRRRPARRRPRRPPPPATEEQPAAVSPWASPATTSFETVTSPSQGYQPEATPGRLRGHPEPGRPAGWVRRRRLRTGLRPAVHAGGGGDTRAGARSRAAGLDPQPSGPAPGDAGVGRPRPRRCGGRHSRRPPSGAGHRGPRGLGARALLQRLDRLGRRPPAHRRSVTRARSAGMHVGEGVRALARGRAPRGRPGVTAAWRSGQR